MVGYIGYPTKLPSLDYAVIWWGQLVTNMRRNYERHVDTWEELKALMRKRFIPGHYYRELYQKLHHLYQGSRSVEDYHTEMEVAMIRINVEEDREATMARFLGGLNKEIASVVELHHYVELEDMLHMAIKVERQLKKKSTSRYNTQGTSAWKGKWAGNDKREGGFNKPKAESGSKGREVDVGKVKIKSEVVAPRSNEIKYFKCLGMGHYASQCPNKRTLVMKADGDIDSTDGRSRRRCLF